MKIFCYCLVLSACFVGHTQDSKEEREVVSKLHSLIEEKNYFELQRMLDTEPSLSERERLYFYAHLENARFKGTQSNDYIDRLLNGFRGQLADTTLVQLLTLKASNQVRNYQYASAAKIYQSILNDYDQTLDSARAASIQNVANLYGTLAEIPPQRIHLDKDVAIPAYRNRFDHLMVPVKSGGIQDEFLFDTGANLSTVAYSYAVKMGMQIFESEIHVGSSTTSIKTRLAVADSLYLGDILYENIVFLVTSDEELTFPSVNLEIHGILGFPVIAQMSEIHLHRDGKIFVPKTSRDRQLNNMFIDGLQPVVQFISKGDSLLLMLDTGANVTELSVSYLEQNRSYVEANGELRITNEGGAGGVTQESTYILQDFPYSIGTKSGKLKEIAIQTEKSFIKHFDGNLGQDVLSQYKALILNFEHMYMDFD